MKVSTSKSATSPSCETLSAMLKTVGLFHDKSKSKNMTKKITILLFLCFNISRLEAQKCKTDSIVNAKVQMPLTLSYFSNFIIDPGVKLGIERPFSIIQKDKVKKNGKQKSNKHIFLNTLNMGYYYTNEHNHSPFLNMEVGYRKIRKSGFKTETFLGIGYMRTILTDETYEVDNDGNVNKIGLAGSSYFMPSICFGLGYDNSYHNKNFPISVSAKPNLFFRLPYNHSILTQLGVELNLSYKFNSMSSKVKQIFKSK